MTESELKKLKRVELLEMLVGEMEENERLKNLLHEQTEQLQNRRIAIDRAGSIAEAALDLNGVFEAAQKAADEYLENIKSQNEQQDLMYSVKIEEAVKEAERIHKEADEYVAAKRAEADSYKAEKYAEAEAYVAEKKNEAATYLQIVSKRVQEIMQKENISREQLLGTAKNNSNSNSNNNSQEN